MQKEDEWSRPLEGFNPEEVFTVYRLSVGDAFRRQGIAKALMNEAEAFAKDNGAVCMSLATISKPATKFYKSIGYQTSVPGKPNLFIKEL